MQIAASMPPSPTSLLKGQTRRQTGPGLVQTPAGGTYAQTGGRQTLKGRRIWSAGNLTWSVLSPGQRVVTSCLCLSDCKGSIWFSSLCRACCQNGLHSIRTGKLAWSHLAEAVFGGKRQTCSADPGHVSCDVDVTACLFVRVRSQLECRATADQVQMHVLGMGSAIPALRLFAV